jgi:hypothetical protein
MVVSPVGLGTKYHFAVDGQQQFSNQAVSLRRINFYSVDMLGNTRVELWNIMKRRILYNTTL